MREPASLYPKSWFEMYDAERQKNTANVAKLKALAEKWRNPAYEEWHPARRCADELEALVKEMQK